MKKPRYFGGSVDEVILEGDFRFVSFRFVCLFQMTKKRSIALPSSSSSSFSGRCGFLCQGSNSSSVWRRHDKDNDAAF